MKNFSNDILDTPEEELKGRIGRFRKSMEDFGIDALVITGFNNFEYLAGHIYSAWDLHARPIYAVLSQEKFVVIACSFSERLFNLKPRIFDIQYYSGMQAEAAAETVRNVKNLKLMENAVIALDYGQDMMSRGSLELVEGLQGISSKVRLISGEKLIWSVRKIKSDYEAFLKKKTFEIVNNGFDNALKKAYRGMTEEELYNEIKINFINLGAERVDAMGLLFGRDTFVYGRLPSQKCLELNDYIWGDFYPTYRSVPSDRCRIARCGEPSAEEKKAYQAVRAVTIGVCESIRPGMTGHDIYHNFDILWKESGLEPFLCTPGRIGHTSGLDITEPGSVADWSNEIVEEGMIFHIEPKYEKYGGIFQFEEVVYVREKGVEFLSELSPKEIPVVPA